MLSAIRKLFLYIDLIINHGISPSTILTDNRNLKYAGCDKLGKDQDEHGM